MTELNKNVWFTLSPYVPHKLFWSWLQYWYLTSFPHLILLNSRWKYMPSILGYKQYLCYFDLSYILCNGIFLADHLFFWCILHLWCSQKLYCISSTLRDISELKLIRQNSDTGKHILSSTVLRLTKPLESLPTSGVTTSLHVLCKIIPSKHSPSQELLKNLALRLAEKFSAAMLRIKCELLAVSSKKPTISRQDWRKGPTAYSL